MPPVSLQVGRDFWGTSRQTNGRAARNPPSRQGDRTGIERQLRVVLEGMGVAWLLFGKHSRWISAEPPRSKPGALPSAQSSLFSLARPPGCDVGQDRGGVSVNASSTAAPTDTAEVRHQPRHPWRLCQRHGEACVACQSSVLPLPRRGCPIPCLPIPCFPALCFLVAPLAQWSDLGRT